MMGKLAKELVALSGPDSVHGIIPEGIIRAERQGVAVDETDREYGKTTVVVDLQTRKKTMLKEVIEGGPGSGFIGLSGGFGTMDELMEAVTWNQLGVHNTGVCLLNVEQFWNGVLSWLDDATKAGFIRDDAKGILVAKETPEECLEWLKGYIPAETRLNQTLKDA